MDAKVVLADLGKSQWFIFIGYLNGKPFEIFSGLANDENGILLPRSVREGLINKENEDGYTRFDFQYQNKRGYKTTIEGINFIFNHQINVFDKIVSNLLQSNVHLNVVIETIKQMEVEDKMNKNWNKMIIEILENKLI